MKIAVIGYSGAGKSTLAQMLSEKYRLPLLHMDHVSSYGDWQERSMDEKEEIVLTFLKAHPEGWIIDGNYYNTAHVRFEMCDVIYFLDYNRFYCYIQCLKRYLKYKGKARPSCPCPEKFDFEFQKWILFEGRTLKIRKQHHGHFKAYGKEKHHFKNRSQLKAYLDKIKDSD